MSWKEQNLVNWKTERKKKALTYLRNRFQLPRGWTPLCRHRGKGQGYMRIIPEQDVKQIALNETKNQTLESDAGGGEVEQGHHITSAHIRAICTCRGICCAVTGQWKVVEAKDLVRRVRPRRKWFLDWTLESQVHNNVLLRTGFCDVHRKSPPNFRAHSHLVFHPKFCKSEYSSDGALAEEQELSRHSRRNVNLLHGNTELSSMRTWTIH